MRPQYTIVTDVATEPVSYADAAAHLRVDSTDDQTYIEALVAVSREYVDQLTGRVSAAMTWKLTAPSWESIFEQVDAHAVSVIDPRKGLLSWIGSDYVIPLRRTPLVSVSSVKYYAPDAVALTTMSASAYRVVTAAEPGLIQLVDAPPSVDDRVDAIQIEFVAGAAASELQKHAIKLMVANLYENRMPVAFTSCQEIEHTLGALLNLLKKGGWF